MFDSPIDLPTNTEQQLLHMSGFVCIIYAILNTSVILKRNETRLKRNKTCLVRNEMRGGKLLLSGTVLYPGYQKFHPNFCSFHDESPACSGSPIVNKLEMCDIFLPWQTAQISCNYHWLTWETKTQVRFTAGRFTMGYANHTYNFIH